MSDRERRAAGQTQTAPKSPAASTPAALYAAGLVHLRAGRKLDAQLCCQQSLAIDPGHADTLHLMGLLCLDAKQHDHAVEWIARAIRQDAKAEYLTSLGTTLQQQGRHEEALKAFDKAVQLKPDVGELWKNLGNVLLDLKRPEDALLGFQHALKLTPRHWHAAHQSAVLLYNAGRFEEALPLLDQCIEQQPNHVPSRQLRALSLKGLKRFEEALAENHRAYAIDPNDSDTCNNIGDVLQLLDRHEEALPWFDRAIALRPGYVLAINNKAFLLGQMHRFDEAFAIYEGLQRDGINTPVTDWNLSLLHMMTGNFEAGWRGREARWKAPVLAVTYPNFEQKMWLGEGSIEGKTVLIHADEGLGDSIQFARYVPDVAARGARVILVVAQPVHSLLARLPGVSECLPLPGGPLPAFDLHCPLSSLPLAFGTRLDTIPSAMSYLPPPPMARVQAWESRLPAHDKLRVGLVWSGNPAHGNDRNRSIPLRMLSRILELDATFVSLQKNPKASDRETLSEHPEIIDFTADLTDFSETAALACCLDLVITVDTSVAHLAAALGRPTWILLPYTPDYRWLLDRDDSPWYRTARLFRQSARRDYGEVLDRVRSELALAAAALPMPKYPASLDPTSLDPTSLDSTSLHPTSVGATLQLQGRYEEALEAFDRAVQLDPNKAGPWLDLGHVQVDLKRPADALLSFQHALKLDPRNWNAASKCGIVLYQMGRFQEAHGYFDLCNEVQPDDATTLYMRGRALLDLGRLEEALADSQRAHELDPRNAEICNSIGAILRSQGHEEQALPWFNQAVRLQPNSVPALTNRAVCLAQLQRFDEAFAAYAHVKALDPDNAEIAWKLALLQLLTGNFEDGWAGREARWNIASRPLYPAFNEPKWLGKEPVDGKTVVICADEGLGDTIHYARYVPMVAARGARVILIVNPPVVSLLSGLPGVAECLPLTGGPLPAFDMHIPICSLPLAFGTRLDTIPSESAYLSPPDASRIRVWEQRLRTYEKSRDKLRVGLVWSGNPQHQNDHNRSMRLRMLSRILDVEVTFVSLQKDPQPADNAMLLERPDIIDLTADLHDFSETAALVNCLDLVITVDTSVAHLAAALGRPTWILLPYTPDYRWLLGRDDSPWYPAARLFRQSARRDYGEVLERVRDALLALSSERQAGDQASPAALCEAGSGHRRAGRHSDAVLCCEQALSIDPGHAEALHLMGLLSLEAGQHDHAVEWLSRAIRQDPRTEFLSSLGITLQQQGRHEEALNVFDKAVQLKPDDAALWSNLGNALMELQRKDEALLSFQHALKLDPLDWEAAYKSFFVLHALGRFEQALAHFDRYSELQPDHIPALQLQALSLRGLRRSEEALVVNQRAIALDPDNTDTCNNLGDALQSLGRSEEALQWFDRAIELRPDLIQALKNKAFVLTQLHRFAEAIAVYQRILTLDPADAAAECDLAQLSLLTGDFEAGWARREARWRLSSTYPKFSQPMWLGKEAVEGKTILVYADEGMGDSIQFARYVPKLAARGARVILVVEAPVVPLLAELAGVAQCIAKPLATPPAFDMHCPMCSLPLAFETRLDNIPSDVSYLPALPEKMVRAWEDRLGAHDKLRVGLVWSGNPLHGNDHNRSLPLRLLTPILDADATFVSLQRDPRPEDRAVLSERADLLDFTLCLTDFSETAALMSCLDLVITVDTSVAHLAGALGCPTWILLPYVPDYRWLLDRDDSPWYPTARLFRQSGTREYISVLDRVRSELDALIPVGEHAPKLDPYGWNSAERNATLLFQSGRLEEAVASFTQCAQLRPDHAPTLQMRALGLYGLNRFDEGWSDIARAHALDTANPDICNNAGVFLQKLGRHEEALSWFDRALERQADYPAAYTNKASSLTQLRRFDEAFAVYDKLLQLHPDHPESHWAIALLQLLTGNFEAGWAGREVRWRVPDLPIFRFKFSQPMWLGQASIGKTILIHVDEGLGDTIQFVRYVPMVAALGARVVLVVADPLYPLLSSMAGVAECLPLSQKTMPAFDLYCPISSLPLAFGTKLDTIPCATPYLPSPAIDRIQAFEDRLGAHERLRVGLVWAGNPKHKNDSNRSVAPRMLAPLLDLDATFVSLQKDARPDDTAWLAERGVIDLAGDIADFADTAALVSCLDLVISVDTSVAHLAGALGCPTWMLIPNIPDYRWLLDRDDSPWYPTVRLFRQTESREYTSVLDRVRSELKELILARQPR